VGTGVRVGQVDSIGAIGSHREQIEIGGLHDEPVEAFLVLAARERVAVAVLVAAVAVAVGVRPFAAVCSVIGATGRRWERFAAVGNWCERRFQHRRGSPKSAACGRDEDHQDEQPAQSTHRTTLPAESALVRVGERPPPRKLKT